MQPAFASLAIACVLAVAAPAAADCGFELSVKNESSSTFTVTKISTSSIPPNNARIAAWKSQWTGARTIAAGATERFRFTVDSCPSSKERATKVFYTARGGSTVYEDVERHGTDGTQVLR